MALEGTQKKAKIVVKPYHLKETLFLKKTILHLPPHFIQNNQHYHHISRIEPCPVVLAVVVVAVVAVVVEFKGKKDQEALRPSVKQRKHPFVNLPK